MSRGKALYQYAPYQDIDSGNSLRKKSQKIGSDKLTPNIMDNHPFLSTRFQKLECHAGFIVDKPMVT